MNENDQKIPPPPNAKQASPLFEPPKPEGDVAPVRTYKADVAEYIKKEGKTMADIAIAETTRNTAVLQNYVDKTEQFKKYVIMTAVAAALLFMSALALWFVFFRPGPATISPYVNSAGIAEPMFVTGVKEKTVTLAQIEGDAALDRIGMTLRENEPLQIIYVKTGDTEGNDRPAKARDFFGKVGIYTPGDFLRTLKDQFALGSIAGKARFVVLKTNYRPGMVSSMFGWEKTMENDLRNLLDLSIPNLVRPPVASGTPQARYAFTDSVVEGRDARVLRDYSGNIILLYLYPDMETVLITGHANAARIVPDKLLHPKR